MATVSYPTSRKDELVDSYHNGKFKFHDNYRWLEDPDSDETKAWVNAQQSTTSSYLEHFSDLRTKLRGRMEQLYNYGRSSAPIIRGSNAFVFRNTGLQNQDVLYRLTAPATSTAPSAGEVEDVFGSAVEFMNLNTQVSSGHHVDCGFACGQDCLHAPAACALA